MCSLSGKDPVVRLIKKKGQKRVQECGSQRGFFFREKSQRSGSCELLIDLCPTCQTHLRHGYHSLCVCVCMREKEGAGREGGGAPVSLCGR